MQRQLNPQRLKCVSTQGNDHEKQSKNVAFKYFRTLKQIGTIKEKESDQIGQEKQLRTFFRKKRDMINQKRKLVQYPEFKDFFMKNVFSSKSPVKANPRISAQSSRKQLLFSESSQFPKKRAESIGKAKFSLPISFLSQGKSQFSIVFNKESFPRPETQSEQIEIGMKSLHLEFCNQNRSMENKRQFSRQLWLQKTPNRKKFIEAFQFHLSPSSKDFIPAFVGRKHPKIDIDLSKNHYLLKIPSFLKKTTSSEKKDILISDFRIVKGLGVGKFGEYFMAIHKKSGFLLTIQRFIKERIVARKLVQKIVSSIKCHYSINHSNVRNLFGIFDDESNMYVAMEYMEGTLTDFLWQRIRFPQSQVVQKLSEICEAVKHIHEKGLIHRDLKLENIYLSHNVCKVCHFELATTSEKGQLRKGRANQTGYQKSLEMMDFQPMDASFDVWCLGLLAYHMFVGRSLLPSSVRKSKSCYKISNIITPSKIDFPKAIPRAAKEFITKLLEPASKNTITARRLLEDPYILSNKERNSWQESEETGIEKVEVKWGKEEDDEQKNKVFLRKNVQYRSDLFTSI